MTTVIIVGMSQQPLSYPLGAKSVPSVSDLSTSSALVVDGNPTSRTVLVGQLRDFGMGTVVQCTRLADARRQLELRRFDVVLCELEFDDKNSSGQELLDDLRRNQLLPFSTVFIMVTSEATYTKVAEAAESALDGYLLKPHSAAQLGDRLQAARHRKLSLQDIFSAIEAEEFSRAAELCLHRFEVRGAYWLYAARIGAELMLRTGKVSQAQSMYEAVVAAKTLPWAKLGVARAQLDAGQLQQASSTLENLIGEDPGYVDAYEVLARAQLEAGRMDKALENYRMACDLTPHSITRVQSLGMMTYYTGNRVEAEKLLNRATRLGLDSKMFDCQSLVLMAFARFEAADRKGLKRCQDDLLRLMERRGESPRLQRFFQVLTILEELQAQQLAKVLKMVRAMCAVSDQPDFDFEAACNLVTVLSLLASRSIQLDEVQQVIDRLAQRFCASRALTELLGGCAYAHDAYAQQIQAAFGEVMRLIEQSMSHSLRGKPQITVQELLDLGKVTRNSKVIETAQGILQRHSSKIAEAATLTDQVLALRRSFARTPARPTLGEQKRQAGGLNLRVMAAPAAPASGQPSAT